MGKSKETIKLYRKLDISRKIKFPFYRKFNITNSLSHSNFMKYERTILTPDGVKTWSIYVYAKNNMEIRIEKADYFDETLGKSSTEQEFLKILNMITTFVISFLLVREVEIK